MEQLESQTTGLSATETRKRLEANGRNELPKAKRASVLKIFLSQLKDPIELLLLVVIGLSLLINEVFDAIAIGLIVLIDLTIGTVEEYKAQRNARALADIIKTRAVVWRDGQEVEIDAAELVVGDIVKIESGVKVAADVRLLECHNLQINESSLTGESVAENKTSQAVAAKTPLADRESMAYAGTAVITGRGKGVVVATGLKTEIGKVADSVINYKQTKSPLTIRMEQFSKQISIFIVITAVIIAAVLLAQGYESTKVFMSVIALSVSAMPEGLPLALTMVLSVASKRMSKKNVIVKNLNSVESLGSCTVIASDKTGTLTVNEQTAKKIILPDGTEFTVSGSGYNGEGEISGEGDMAATQLVAKMGALNNEARLEQQDDKWFSHGDSIDIAFLALALKAGVDATDVKIVGRIPYESEKKFSAVFYEKDGQTFCTIKGSPETILSMCETSDVAKIQAQNEQLASDGLRVIALANGQIENFTVKENYTSDDIKDLEFAGLVGFIDPVRSDAIDSIADCQTAGIKVVMITGDHPKTALAIARELNLADSLDQVATGDDINAALAKGEAEFDQFIANKKVFARVTPLEKLAIVESYRRQGEFVAVTGDGVNDAPAIKSANLGVAMGSGTDVAREAASMIIVDDKFSSIVHGVREGRTAYANIRKVSYMLLTCGVAEVLFFVLAIIAGMDPPLAAIQLLWLNVVTDGLQDFALSFEKTEEGTMQQPPRPVKESLFNHELIIEVAVAGLSMGLIVFGVWVYLINHLHMEIHLARAYIMTLMVFLQNMHVLNARSETKSFFSIPLLRNPWVFVSISSAIILQIIVIEVPFFNQFLKTSSLPAMDIVWLFVVSLSILVIVEIFKFFKRRRLRAN